MYLCPVIKHTKTLDMKKLSMILVVAGFATMVSCGPNAEQTAEIARLDSIRHADSIALVEAEMIRIQDSIAFEMANDTTLVEIVVE